MREILFRGKNLLGKWITGDLLQYLGCGKKHIVQQYKGAGGQEVDPSTVGEYTGLKDENGKRIFEGDIVITKHNGQHNAYSIIYAEEFATFIGRDKDNFNFTTLSCLDSSQLEVIANIHDNPELLKG